MENTNFEISLTQNGDVIIGLTDTVLDVTGFEIVNDNDTLYLTDGLQSICLQDLPDEFYNKIIQKRKMYFSYMENQKLELLQVNVPNQ
ncbi:hypothetical protein [Vibrio owensii]|uniref:hypothetical protein n=1 Tax=Vibrio harveyi group TaxID=717610 RepID=UPI003CC5DFB2